MIRLGNVACKFGDSSRILCNCHRRQIYPLRTLFYSHILSILGLSLPMILACPCARIAYPISFMRSVVSPGKSDGRNGAEGRERRRDTFMDEPWRLYWISWQMLFVKLDPWLLLSSEIVFIPKADHKFSRSMRRWYCYDP